ncbi:unnamed protein product [Caenorhabditis brenneri]
MTTILVLPDGPVIRRTLPYFSGRTHLTFDEVVRRVVIAVRDGCFNISVTSDYSRLDAIGYAIEVLIASHIVSRDELCIRLDLNVTECLWNNRIDSNMAMQLQTSLTELRIRKVDCLMARVPTASDIPRMTKRPLRRRILQLPVRFIWNEMMNFVRMDKTRFIGIMNWEMSDIDCIMRMGRTVPQLALFQIRNHAAIQFCQHRGIPCCLYLY